MKVKTDGTYEKNSLIKTKIITNTQEILDNETAWNNFVTPKNPLLYSKIFVGFMTFSRKKGWTPLIITFWSDQKIVGMAPLKIKPSFYSNQVRNLRDDLYSDFVFSEKHRQTCMKLLIDLIFKHLNCKLASIVMDTNSANLKIFENECSKNKLTVTKKQDLGRAVIFLNSSYERFYSLLKNKTKKEFRRINRRLDELGSWKIYRAPITDETLETIIETDKKSWKETHRNKTKSKEDFMLRLFLESSLPGKFFPPAYTAELWFLKINNKTVAYQLVFHHFDVSIFLKTSFDDNFRQLSIGKFLMNQVIHETFKKKSTKKIDFITNLPFVKTWNPTCETRTRIFVDVNPLISKTFKILTQNRILQKIGFTLKL